jgi:hypothetical protein
MRSVIRVLTVGLFVTVTASLLLAQSPQALERYAGTWKQNIAKSKFDPGPALKSQTVVIRMSGGGLLATADNVNSQGQPGHIEISLKFDGKDYSVKGATQPTTQAFKWIDDYTMEWVNTVNGKQTTTTHISLSRDGKTQTLTTTGTNAQGQKINNVGVFEKQ